MIQHNNKLGTITELNLFLCLGRNLDHTGTGSGTLNLVINFLAHQRIISALQHLDKSLSAGIYNPCLL